MEGELILLAPSVHWTPVIPFLVGAVDSGQGLWDRSAKGLWFPQDKAQGAFQVWGLPSLLGGLKPAELAIDK